MTRRIAIAFILLAACFGAAFAQPDSLWSRTYGGSESDICYSSQQTSDGAFILAGLTSSAGAVGIDGWLVKAGPAGDTIWDRTSGGNQSDRFFAVQETADGGFICGGNTLSFGEGSADVWVVKTQGDGAEVWSHTNGGNQWDQCNALQQTSDQEYVLAGSTSSFGQGEYDFWLLRLTTQGDTLWTRTYGGADEEYCNSVRETADGGYILGGSTRSYGAGNSDMWVVKTDAGGNELWSRAYGTTGTETCRSVRETADGGFMVGGTSGDADFWLLKTDINGETLWSREYGGQGIEEFQSLEQTLDGGFILGGKSTSFGLAHGLWVLRTDAGGDSLWSLGYAGSGVDVCHSVWPNQDGGYAVAGRTTSFGFGSADAWLIVTEPDPVMDVDDQLAPPNSRLNMSVYPNPFNPSTVISFELPRAIQTRLQVFDLAGRLVWAEGKVFRPAGSHKVRLEAPELASGVYVCRLEAGEQSESRRMLLLK